MINFWTKIKLVGRTYIRCFHSRVLRNTRQILLVNFIRCEVRRGRKLFVWLTRMCNRLQTDEPNRFLLSWGETVREREKIFLTTAEKLVGKILTPWADRIFENNHDAMRTCQIGNGNVVPIINLDAVVKVVEPNENGNARESRYHVNLNARTCTCTNGIYNGIAYCHALKAWDVYHAQQNDIPLNEFGRRIREWAVDSKPWFLASKFIQAAEVLKTERIKLPADANIEVDDKCFPPVCLAKLKPGRSVQEVAVVPHRSRELLPQLQASRAYPIKIPLYARLVRLVRWRGQSFQRSVQVLYSRSPVSNVSYFSHFYFSFNRVAKKAQNGRKTPLT